MSSAREHQIDTVSCMLWRIFFIFGMSFGASFLNNHRSERLLVLKRIYFSSYDAKLVRFYHRTASVSSRHFLWCSFSSCNTYFLNLFTLPIYFKWSDNVGTERSNLGAISYVVWEVSASTTVSNPSLSTLIPSVPRGWFPRVKLLDWNSSTHQNSAHSFTASSTSTSLMLRAVWDTLLPQRNSYL